MIRKPSVRTHPFGADETKMRPAPALPSAQPLEAQLAALETRLDFLKAQVRQAQQLAGLGTAAAMIAHEVSNLLTPILSYARAAVESGDGDLQRKALSVTVRNVEMLLPMVDRVLAISAAKPAAREPVNIRAAVEDALASLCRDLSKDGIGVSIEVDDALTVQADGLQLRQVLFNLFLNAREAMTPKHSGRLSISAGSDGDRLAIRVRNTGDPIAPDRLPHIFDAFESTKPATVDGRHRCSGLGLALCHDLVEENGGRIDVFSNAESGTTFTIQFPVIRRSDAPMTAQNSPSAGTPVPRR